ncbi:MAG: hypothetical protein WAV92_03785, partial [Halopseudomonas yangmingensis]
AEPGRAFYASLTSCQAFIFENPVTYTPSKPLVQPAWLKAFSVPGRRILQQFEPLSTPRFAL